MNTKIKLTLILMLIPALSFAAVKTYSVKVVKEYPHNASAYTQGLFFNNDKLYETTGLYGQSSIREVNLETGEVKRIEKLAPKYFGEGSVILNNILYVLTWNNKVILMYDPDTFERLDAYTYPVEGWGLTTDGKSLIASDGTDNIYFLSPELKFERKINVRLRGKYIKAINELEYINGKIWANIYTTDCIAIINPVNGEVEGLVDCSGLLPDYLKTKTTDVLNGIAFNRGRIYVTGKNWPRLYEIKIQ